LHGLHNFRKHRCGRVRVEINALHNFNSSECRESPDGYSTAAPLW
jgi:hypothetical protein